MRIQAVRADEPGSTTELETVTISATRQSTQTSPLEGLVIDKDQIPGNVQSVSAADIKKSQATSLTDLMNTQLQSVNVNDYQGNPFQMDVSYRGFSASPQLGTPQGLSVFIDGVRVNEPFGDVVNWDLIPLNAISSLNVMPGSNPLFGLNTLGGALSLRTRNGFDDAGVELSMQGGSWGRKHGQLAIGGNNGTVGGFLSINGFSEDGWRDNSPSDVKQGFARIDLRGERYSLRASGLLVGNDLLGNGMVPLAMYRQRPESVFSSPDQTRNNLQQYTLAGQFDFTDRFNVTGQIYRRASRRQSLAGDIYEDFQDMDATWDTEPRVATGGTTNGLPICQYQDINRDGIPDYRVASIPGVINPPIPPGETPEMLPPINASGDCALVEYVRPHGLRPRNGATSVSKETYPNSRRGWIDGTPIGVLTQSSANQVTDGAALQLNWNLDQHKFMVGGSIDSARTDFQTRQRLGLIDASHRVYLDPAAIDPLYRAGRQDIVNNRFDGSSNTYSGYFSETYSPLDNLHISLAGRFNQTVVKNSLKARTRAGFDSLDDIRDTSMYNNVIVCPSADPNSCPAVANYVKSNFGLDAWLSQDPHWGLGKYSETPTAERFVYNAFNPSVGINWLPKEDLNVFFNWSQGNRAPSTIELGCAYDNTPVPEHPGDPNSQMVPKSFASVGGACTLPTALSGDPYLAQIFARTYEFGLRGKVFDGWEWNAGVYRTDLTDDIYLVGVTSTRSFFQNIGDTRRQGFEFGLSGSVGIADIRVNYGYTDASFQSRFFMASQYNSSARVDQPAIPRYDSDGMPVQPLQDMIRVDPGNRMPGIPLHNINVSLDLHLTPQWDFGVTLVAHSDSFVRGNENNRHRAGDWEYAYRFNGREFQYIRTRQFTDDGTVPGYAVFNLRTSYRLGGGFTAFAKVNNLFDREYFSAGRLGINPYSPSIDGDIGPSGWNYNSDDWLRTTMVAPGAPRAYWVGLEYRFD